MLLDLLPVEFPAGTAMTATVSDNLGALDTNAFGYGYGLSDRESLLESPGLARLTGLGLSLPGQTGNYATTPDAAPLRITGDIDISARVALDDWTPVGTSSIYAKWDSTGNQRSINFAATPTGNLFLQLSTDGIVTTTYAVSSSYGLINGTAYWVRATWRASDGRVQFFTAPDSSVEPSGGGWTQLGTDRTVAIGSIFNSTASGSMGGLNAGGTSNQLKGAIYRVLVRNGIAGTIALDADFSAQAVGVTSFVEGSANAATVTVNSARYVGSDAIVDAAVVPSDNLGMSDPGPTDPNPPVFRAIGAVGQSGVSTPTVVAPACQVGDLLVAIFASDGAFTGGPTVATLSGWTLVANIATNLGLSFANGRAQIFTKLADATDAAGAGSYTWAAGPIAGQTTGVIVAYANASTIEIVGSVANSGTAAPSITTMFNREVIIYVNLGENPSGGSPTAPTGYTNRLVTGLLIVAMQVADKTTVAAGATGTATPASSDWTAFSRANFQFALRGPVVVAADVGSVPSDNLGASDAPVSALTTALSDSEGATDAAVAAPTVVQSERALMVDGQYGADEPISPYTRLMGGYARLDGYGLVLNASNALGKIGASLPDTGQFTATTALDLRVRTVLVPFYTQNNSILISQWDATNNKRSWSLGLSLTGNLFMTLSSNGTNAFTLTSTATLQSAIGNPFSTWRAVWIRSTVTASAGTATVKFWHSIDEGVTWTQLGADVTLGISAFANVNSTVWIGNIESSSVSIPFSGSITRAQVYNSINGTALALDANFANVTGPDGTTFTESSSNAGTVTVHVPSTAQPLSDVGVVPSDQQGGTDGLVDVVSAFVPDEAMGILDTAGVNPEVAASDAAGFLDASSVGVGIVSSDPVGGTDAVTEVVGASILDAFGLSDVAEAAVATTFLDYAGLSDVMSPGPTIALSEALGLLDVATTQVTFGFVFNDAAGLVDGLTEATAVMLSDVEGVSDPLAANLATLFGDSVGLLDVVSAGVAIPFVESEGLTDDRRISWLVAMPAVDINIDVPVLDVRAPATLNQVSTVIDLLPWPIRHIISGTIRRVGVTTSPPELQDRLQVISLRKRGITITLESRGIAPSVGDESTEVRP